MKTKRRKINQETKAGLYIVVGTMLLFFLGFYGLGMTLFTPLPLSMEDIIKIIFIIIGMVICVGFITYAKAFLDRNIWKEK